jgi:hypothetical protein
LTGALQAKANLRHAVGRPEAAARDWLLLAECGYLDAYSAGRT